jgi:HEPN domain-containing protein
VPEEIWEASDLTRFAVETRYPIPAELVTEEEYREAVQLAERVLQWAASIIESPRQ